ncbi:MAG TPA: hypothetical protein VFU15_16685 [Bacteroidia bacterium]|nr:hypothetical protein [Bacteroidia bacterium]
MNRRKNIRLGISIAGAMLLLLFADAFPVAWTDMTKEEFDGEMQKTSQFYTVNQHYSVQVDYASFRGYDSEIPYDQSTGYYRKDGKSYHNFLLGIHTIQNSRYKVIVDTAKKAILVADPENEESAAEMKQLNFDNESKYVTAYKSAPSGGGKLLRVEFNKIPAYTAYTIDISDDGRLRGMTIYYRESYPLDPSDPSSAKAQPKLKITYSAFDAGKTFDSKKEFDTSKYFTEADGKLTLTAAFKNYTITDLRIPTKKKS